MMVIVLGMALTVALSNHVEARKAAEKTRAATIKQLMKGIVGSNCGGLKGSLDAATTDWDAVSQHAALLNESGFLLLDDGRCPDAEWAKGAKALQTCSTAILKAAEDKNLDAAKTAFGELTKNGCAVCHTAHKK
ncbi:MAG: hypothetical protein J0M07_30690 [Anaerolineae bacterium]|nr:hypothetical protein [Anaerolineae bacterium]